MPLARTHYIIGLNPGDHPEPAIAAVEAEIAAAARTWQDRFHQALREDQGAASSAPTSARVSMGAFPPGYQDQFGPEEALADLEVVETLSDAHPVQVRVYRGPGDPKNGFRFKLYRFDEAAPLVGRPADRRADGAEGPGRTRLPTEAPGWAADLGA